MTKPTLNEILDSIRPHVGQMLRIREVRGVRLKDGRELTKDGKHSFVLYDDGVQQENGGATLFGWEEIAEVLV